jgi:hypothetical protein
MIYIKLNFFNRRVHQRTQRKDLNNSAISAFSAVENTLEKITGLSIS